MFYWTTTTYIAICIRGRTSSSIITLSNTQWVRDNTKEAIEFREFLTKIDYNIKMLPDNSFIEKGKTVPTMLLKIKKPTY